MKLCRLFAYAEDRSEALGDVRSDSKALYVSFGPCAGQDAWDTHGRSESGF